MSLPINDKKPFRESLNRHIGTILLPSIFNKSDSTYYNPSIIDDFRKIGENKNFGFNVSVVESPATPWIEDYGIAINNGSVTQLSQVLEDTIHNKNLTLKTLDGQEIPLTDLTEILEETVHGGNILTVEKPNGQDGYLIGKHSIRRLARTIFNLVDVNKITEAQIQETKEIIAMALKVDLKDITWIDQAYNDVNYHIDCFLTGLGNGTIAINNPKEAIQELEKVKKTNEYKNFSNFRKWSIDKMLETMKADLPKAEKLYSSVKNELIKNGYKIVKVPGIYYRDRTIN
jgi:hypothetical protein